MYFIKKLNNTLLKSFTASIIFIFIFCEYSSSQITLLNAGFEDGTDSTTSNWIHLPIGSDRVQSYAASGNYSMCVWNWYSYAQGWCINGTTNILSSSISLEEAGTPFVQKPLIIQGMYRYDTTQTSSTNDSAVVQVFLKKYNSSLQSIDIVASGEVHLPATDSTQNFVSFEVQINDLMPGINPDSIIILMESSINGYCSNVSGNCLYFYVDDLTAGFPLGINVPLFNNEIKFWPNPVEEELNILLIQNKTAIATIVDASGKILLSQIINSNDKLDLSFLKSGNYILNIENEGKNTSHKIIKK